MMSSRVASGGFTFSKMSVGGNWFWTVVANNIVSSNQQYIVSDIISPYGKINTVDIPIPGDVILEMATSISQLQQQLNPSMALVSGTQTIFSMTLTEGDVPFVIGTVQFTNIGAFGSFMSVTGSPSAAWISGSPSIVNGLNKNDVGSMAIQVNPTIMLASSSPYVGTLSLQDNKSPPTVIPITVNIIVLPKPTIQLSSQSATLSYTITGSIIGGTSSVVITNSGPSGSLLSYTASKINNSSWLDISPSSGGPLASGDTSVLTFSINTSGLPSIPGTYIENVLVASSNATNESLVVQVTLTVNP